MQSQLVFQEKKEMQRLSVQNKLLCSYEADIFMHIFQGRSDLTILDIGSNDGAKTNERFASDAVTKVIGLEYNEILAKEAQTKYGNDTFSFYPFDVEASTFSVRLKELMTEKGVDGFDVIYLSFILMHLKDAKKLLLELRPFLKPGGQLVIIEANDRASSLTSDKDGLLKKFLDILKKDKYSGNREIGAELCTLLTDCNYENIMVWHESIDAGIGEKDKKQAIFTTFFSYLSEDVALLLDTEPDNAEYKAWSTWLDCNYKKLERLIIREESEISMGMKMLSCMKGEK